MNLIHNRLCRSDRWQRKVENQLLPWALQDVDLGPDVLEVGPGFGATTSLLAKRTTELTAVEIDERLAERLTKRLGPAVRVVHGDGTALPLPDASYSGVTCFTMLHHVPSHRLQDQIFAEAHRVLRPGGIFAGSDSRPNLTFRLIHLGDTMVVVDPQTLPDRLAAAGFTAVEVTTLPGRAIKFSARKP